MTAKDWGDRVTVWSTDQPCENVMGEVRLLIAAYAAAEVERDEARQIESEINKACNTLRRERNALQDESSKAVNIVADLIVERDRLRAALQALYDEQNGPPLIRHQGAWKAAMKQAVEALSPSAQHADTCMRRQIGTVSADPECTCGFEEALAGSKEAKP